MSLYAKLRNYFVAGLLFWMPVWLTLSIFGFVLRLIDDSISPIVAWLDPFGIFGADIPGLNLVLALAVLLLTGALAANILVHKLVFFGEKIVHRIPLVGAIYQAIKQVLETLFSSSNKAFNKVLLIEYPRKGIWSLAFLTSESVQGTDMKDTCMVFVPTTPNPTSGFIMALPKSDVKELNMSVDEALKMIISLGVVQPNQTGEKA